MLISLGLVFVIMFFSLIVGNVVVTSIRQSSNVNRSTEAYYAAEGALEKGLLENYKQGAGYTSGVTDAGYTGVDATYEIQGQVPEDVKYINNSAYENMYGIPTPGTGNAGKECDPLNPVISGNTGFTYLGVTYSDEDAADHPCNWNKIKTGETVAIPLYFYTKDTSLDCANTPQAGVYLCNASNTGSFALSDLIIRVRTACKNGETMCQDYDRYDFDTDDGDPNVLGDDTILDWQLSGTDSSGDSVVIQPNRDFDELLFLREGGFNSEIYESFINNETASLNLANVAGVDTLNKLPMGYALDFIYNLDKPVLKMTVISGLESDENTKIPYLEYQVLTNQTTAPPANVNQSIKAEGISGTFKQVLEVSQPQAGGIPEYVVQQ